jgi:hypothetical protein
MTNTEQFVHRLCEKSFLSLWSFLNPIGKQGKELCDILIVCEPDVIIFSVKEINIKKSGDPEVDTNRWLERSIESSVKQIYGAERYLKNKGEFILNNSETIIDLSKNIKWIFHRIAVAFGRGNEFPLNFGDYGKGFIHVFDEKSVQVILHELDTIRDFTAYLTAKEEFIRSNHYPHFYAEEDILAYYLLNGRKFPIDCDVIIFDSDLYSGMLTNSDYQKTLRENEVSYTWDKMIETLIQDFNDGSLLNDVSRADLELTIRQMSREDRVHRKILSELFLDFIGVNHPPQAKARAIISSDNPSVLYLFVLGDYEKRHERAKELRIRSIIAREKSNCTTIIGLATEQYNPKRYSLDLLYTYLPELSDEIRQKAKEFSKTLDLFANPIITKLNH